MQFANEQLHKKNNTDAAMTALLGALYICKIAGCSATLSVWVIPSGPSDRRPSFGDARLRYAPIGYETTGIYPRVKRIVAKHGHYHGTFFMTHCVVRQSRHNSIL